MEFLLSLLPLDVADFVGRNPGAVAGTPLAGLIAWILKKIPNDKIKNASYKFCHGVGVVVTLGLAKWKYTKPFWNEKVEPYVIDAVDNLIVEGARGFKDGLRSDNK